MATTSITADRYLAPPCPDAFNIAWACIGHGAQAHPDKTALVVAHGPNTDQALETFTYADIERAILNLGTELTSRGVRRGDRVLIRMANTPSYAFAVFSCFAIGAVALPVSDQLTPRELDVIIADARPAAVVFDQAFQTAELGSISLKIDVSQVDLSRPQQDGPPNYADTGADDPALLIYTSGTTARPKGVIHGHRVAWGRRPMVEGWYGLLPTDRLLHAGAFNWSFTLGTGLIDPWMMGACSVINVGRREPSDWPVLIRQTQATLFAAVPGLIRQILKYAELSPDGMPTLRHGLIAGDTPPPGLFDDWSKATGTRLYEALGMSEISTYVSCSPTTPRRDGAIGKVQLGRAVAILPADNDSVAPVPVGDIGLLAVHRSDPGLMLGYWERPDDDEAVIRGDWFLGGDLASMDEDGYITHHGRGTDVMKPLGYRVSPQEVEAVLMTHPKISEAGCREVEVRDGVRVIAAFVVAKQDMAPPSQQDVLDHAATHLAHYKCPRIVHIVPSLPKTANGKLLRQRLSAAS